jgi:hypothetical protein
MPEVLHVTWRRLFVPIADEVASPVGGACDHHSRDKDQAAVASQEANAA